MNSIEAIRARHSVRSYTERPIEAEKLEVLRTLAAKLNEELHLRIDIITEEPRAFESKLAHYGKFAGVRNYIAMKGVPDTDFDERVGYAGEQLVVAAQMLGLNTCWVGLTFKKVAEALQLQKGEKLRCVIALGYGASQGVSHKIKGYADVARAAADAPAWFRQGVEAALLAPTAMNQQKFTFTLTADGRVKAKAGFGFFSKVDLGIVKYHFEMGAAPTKVEWV